MVQTSPACRRSPRRPALQPRGRSSTPAPAPTPSPEEDRRGAAATTSGSCRSKRARLDRHRSFHCQATQRETLAPWTSAEWAATLRWSGRGRWPAQFGVLSRRSRRNSSISAVAAACRCFAVVGMVLADQVRNASW